MESRGIAKKKKPGKFEKVPAGQPVQTKPVANQHHESQEIWLLPGIVEDSRDIRFEYARS
jgi:hypothetical protein